ncbi:beta-1,3-glucosyltransferase [Ostrinia nubilalis]|uniref:beta-1,3-glucosyltransferase n=1 Tax=Ostrinia nubilalis TaxID=29057 RepID=UPI003082342F
MTNVGTLVLILAYINFVSSFDSRNIVFVIVSQPEPYHASVASLLKQDIEGQILEIDKILPRVHLTHIDFPSPGAWTVIPLLRPLVARYKGSDVRWVLFVEPHTAVRCSQLLEALAAADQHKRLPIVHLTHTDFPSPGAWTVIPLLRPLVARYKGSDVRWVLFVEPHTAVRCSQLLEALAAADQHKETMWIGYPLSDDEPTIIHHFTFYEDLEEEGGFVYPNFASGFAMRMELIEGLLYKVESGERKLEADFSIDPAYELAQLIYGGGSDPGPLLTPDLSFCIVSGDNCATYPRQFDTCGSAIPQESVFFAVKTWSGFHGTRARVVKKTWGRYVTHLQFYSDKDDPSLPAVDTGIPNSKTGHCLKTVAILKQALKRVYKLPHIKWIFLADDDTILGVQRLCEVLSCYRGGSDITILGERYGYGYGKKETAAKGYDYITGGGGTVLSIGAAQELSQCACTALTAPDDMTLGACAALRRNITATHSPLFHQVE